MPSCTFPYNPLLEGMTYEGTDLTIELKKDKANELRTYAAVPQSVAYTLFYKKTGSDVMSFYARFIKKQYTVKEVKPCKR